MGVIDQVSDLLRRLGAPRVVGLILVTGAGVGAIWALVAWGSRADMVPIVTGGSMEMIVEARAALNAEGIENELGRGGAELLISSGQLAEARVALAERGVSADNRTGFELFDEPSWGMTDFTQRINYRRALEGELEKSIGQMRGIRSAEVHLAMREGSVYQRVGQPVEASVMLRLGSSARPTNQQIEAITYLMASAVDGLSSDGVSVLDDAGRVLASAMEANGAGRLDRRRADMRTELEERLEAEAALMIEQVLGAANVRIQVAAELDYEQVERRTDSVDPNQQVLTGEERSEIEPGDPSQGAASTIQHNTFDVTRSTELLTKMPGAIKRLTVAVALNEDAPGTANPAFIAEIEQLVGNAVGLDAARGDAISVVAVPFQAPGPVATPAPPPTGGVLDLVREFQRPALMLFALVLAFVLAMRGLSLARTALPEPAPVLSATAGATQLTGADGSTPGLPGQTVGDVIVGGPNADASHVVRAWLGEG
ncbi:MAG: flagellar basal-body MS-ring/collar protein FliF [Gemmatimonadota bacterium]